MKKVLAIMLGLAMVFAFAGCTGQTAQPTVQPSQGTAATEQPANTEEPLVNTGSLVPVVNEPISMKMAVTVGPMNEDPSKMWFFKYFEEQTNVHWDFTVIQMDAWSEKKPIMMATNDYPDVFFGQYFSSGEIMKYGYAGTFTALNDYIDQYGDIIKQKMDMVDGSWPNITCPNGEIYGLPSLTLAYPFTDNRSWINMKWLDRVGLPLPATLDEYYTALKAFKDQDANGNGDPNDEIPWSGQSKTSSEQRMMMLNVFGFATNGDPNSDLSTDANGNVVYIPLTGIYKDYLLFMNKCYGEGLLDQDYFAQDDVQFKAKGAEGIVGSADYSAPFLMDPAGLKDWVAMALVAHPGDTPVVFKYSSTAIGKFIVTDKCQHPDAAVRWANLFYDPEFAQYIMYGPAYGTDQDPDGIGTRPIFDNEGNWADIETPGWDSSKMNLWDYYSLNHPINSNFNFGIDDSYIFIQLYPNKMHDVQELTAFHKAQIDDPSSPEATLNEAYWRYYNLITDVPYANSGLPTVYLTEEAQARVDELKTPIVDCVKSWEAKFITGAASISSDYDTFISELKKLGAEEYQQIFVDAYK
jgi:putative aldouronate transport system substrate-binding protein